MMMRIFKLPSITFLCYEAILNPRECAKYTARWFFWRAFQQFLPAEYKRSGVWPCWRAGHIHSYHSQALTRDDRHMIELGIHQKQSEYSKQHFAVAILQMEHQWALILIQNDNANSHIANPIIKFLGNKRQECSFYTPVIFLKPDTDST